MPVNNHKEPGEFQVVLIRGPILQTKNAINNEATPPVSFALLKAGLAAQGYGVTLIDGIGLRLNQFWKWPSGKGLCCQGANFEEILAAIPAHPDLLAFTCMFSPEWPVNRELIKAVKKRFPNCPTLAGGEHVTALPEYSLRDCPELDFVAAGEGEQILINFCQALRQGTDPRQVTGLSYLDERGFFHQTGRQPRILDLDRLPWPAWEETMLAPYWREKKSYGVLTPRDMPLLASRGCPYQCTFCSNARMWTTRYVLRQVDEVLDEVQSYLERFQITGLQLYDLTAIIRKNWAIEFCRKKLERGLTVSFALPSGTRCEVLDEEVIGWLAKSGCNYLVYAPESGSPRTRQRIKKRVNIEQMLRSIRAAKRQRLVLRTNLIIGFPEESRGDVWRTLLFGLRLALLGVDEVSINLYTPYPGTELFEELVKAGRLTVNDDYFYATASFNSDYTNLRALTFNRSMSARELALYRALFISLNYLTGYLLHPRRILRTLRNLWRPTQAATVFEHRLQDLGKRLWGER